jgi:hypothetical protein
VIVCASHFSCITNPSPDAFLLWDGIAQRATGWTAEELRGGGFDSWQGQNGSVFFTEFKPALGPTYPSILWVPGALSLSREADHSPPRSGEVMNGGAIPLRLTRLHGMSLNLIKQRGNFSNVF